MQADLDEAADGLLADGRVVQQRQAVLAQLLDQLHRSQIRQSLPAAS